MVDSGPVLSDPEAGREGDTPRKARAVRKVDKAPLAPAAGRSPRPPFRCLSLSLRPAGEQPASREGCRANVFSLPGSVVAAERTERKCSGNRYAEATRATRFYSRYLLSCFSALLPLGEQLG